MNGKQDATAQPPASYTAEDVQAWLADGADGLTVRRLDAFRNRAGRLENLEIQIEVDAATHSVGASDGFRKRLVELTGTDRFEDHFRVPSVAEYVARALAKGGFHGIVRIATDGETVYDHPERSKDVTNTVQMIVEASHRRTDCNAVEITAVDDEFGDTHARATVRRDAKRGQHAIGVKFDGEVPEENFRGMLAQLRAEFAKVFPAA